MNNTHSPLLSHHLGLFRQTIHHPHPILDLACGHGRNGLFLAEQGIPVVFADKNQDALDLIEAALSKPKFDQVREHCQTWLVDFEAGEPEAAESQALDDKQFAGIIVFRYLHRTLFPKIKHAVVDGGFVIYETFTRDHPQFGRPTNLDFLLKPGELEKVFTDWGILHSFEGVTESETGGRKQAIAQIVALKPQ